MLGRLTHLKRSSLLYFDDEIFYFAMVAQLNSFTPFEQSQESVIDRTEWFLDCDRKEWVSVTSDLTPHLRTF